MRRRERLERAERQLGGAEGEEHLADRGAVVGHAAADPLAGAEEVAALDLREVLDAERRRHREVDRLAAGLRERVEVRLGELGEVAVDEPRCAKRSSTGPGPKLPRRPALLHEALALERAEQPRGGALGQVGVAGQLAERARRARPRARASSSCARDRSPAFPAARWNSCSTPDILRAGVARVKDPEPHVRQHDAALRDPLRGGDGRPRPRLAADRLRARASSSCCPRRSSCSARRARRSRASNWSSSTPTSSSSRSPRRRASSTCRRATRRTRVHIGGDHMVFSAVYGPPFVREGDVRRDATMADFENFVKLSQSFPELDSPGGTIVEPNDAPLDSRHLDMVYALQTLSDKPYMGSVISGPNALDTIEMGEIVFGGARRSSARRSRSR